MRIVHTRTNAKNKGYHMSIYLSSPRNVCYCLHLVDFGHKPIFFGLMGLR